MVEFLAKVPVELKLRGMTEKFLLREAMRGVLPESVRVRAKHGLQTPVMREPRMFLDEQRVEGLLGDEMVERCGLFGRGAVRELREKDGDGYLANAIGCVHLFCEVFGICA